MGLKLTDILAHISDMESVENGMIVLLDHIAQDLKDALASGDPAAIQTIIDKIDGDKTQMAAAVARVGVLLPPTVPPVDPVPPVLGAPDVSKITASLPDADGLVQVSGASGSVPAGALVQVSTPAGAQARTTADTGGSFGVQIAASFGDILTLALLDVGGVVGPTATLPVPVDPNAVPPLVDPTAKA